MSTIYRSNVSLNEGFLPLKVRDSHRTCGGCRCRSWCDAPLSQSDVQRKMGMDMQSNTKNIINVERLNKAFTFIRGDAVKVEIYCSVCGLKLCYTE